MTVRARVAVVSDYTLATLGGAENAFHDQVLGLSAVADVLALCPASPRLGELGRRPGVRAVGVPVAFLTPGLGFPVVANTERLRSFFNAQLRAYRIQVLHLHSEFGIAAAAMAAARRLGIGVVQTVHTFFWQTRAPIQTLLAAGGPPVHRLLTGLAQPRLSLADRPGDSALRAMTLASARRADRVISPSAHQAEKLRAAGLPAVDVVPNMVAANPDARPVVRIDGPLQVLWVGRLADEKRVVPFVRAARRAMAVVGPQHLRVRIVGGGPRTRSVRRLLAGQPGFDLCGRVSPGEVVRLLARSHVSVLSSIGWDNQPMTVAESITALRPVIWSDPALREGLDRAGIAAFGACPSVLAETLIDLATDPTPVLQASAAAVEARSLFSAEEFLQSVFESYRAVGAPVGDPAVAEPQCAS